jgi:hypothetical protein
MLSDLTYDLIQSDYLTSIIVRFPLLKKWAPFCQILKIVTFFSGREPTRGKWKSQWSKSGATCPPRSLALPKQNKKMCQTQPRLNMTQHILSQAIYVGLPIKAITVIVARRARNLLNWSYCATNHNGKPSFVQFIFTFFTFWGLFSLTNF